MARPKKTPEPAKAGTTITGCNIQMTSSANEHTRAAVEALAAAAQANANAISAIAEALKPSQAPSYGIYLTQGE